MRIQDMTKDQMKEEIRTLRKQLAKATKNNPSVCELPLPNIPFESKSKYEIQPMDPPKGLVIYYDLMYPKAKK